MSKVLLGKLWACMLVFGHHIVAYITNSFLNSFYIEILEILKSLGI